MSPFLDPQFLEKEFSILKNSISPKPIVYLDTAASSLRCQTSLDAMNAYYTQYSANVHRGVHLFSEKATLEYEAARGKVAKFVESETPSEIIITSGTTHSINIVARGIDRFFKPGDKILITQMEHHSNIVPWQMLSERTGAKLEVAKIFEDGSLDLDSFENILKSGDVKIASFVLCPIL